MAKDNKRVDDLRKALANLDLHLPELKFIEKDAISNVEATQFHNTDRTPVIFDPDVSDGSGGPREFCFSGQAMDIGGKAVTGSDGKMRWKLTNYICEDRLMVVDEPVAFVATARATVARMMTSNTVSTGKDLEIDVFSWDSDGNPAGGTSFSWRCWFNFPVIIL